MCRRRRKLPEKVGDSLTAEQYAEADELGILVDKDDQARLWPAESPVKQGHAMEGAVHHAHGSQN